MGSQASKGGVAVEGKAAAADPAAVKTNGQVIHLPIRDTPTSDQQVFRRELKVSHLSIILSVTKKTVV